MQKILAVIFVLALCLLPACAASQAESTATTQPETTVATTEAPIDVDLTTMSSTMVYSEVSNMISTPENYLGKTVRMQGSFSIYDSGSKVYYACLIADATACCSQGIEFQREGNFSYPDDYPELGTEITVTGIFDTYQEGETTYCQLIHAQMD